MVNVNQFIRNKVTHAHCYTALIPFKPKGKRFNHGIMKKQIFYLTVEKHYFCLFTLTDQDPDLYLLYCLACHPTTSHTEAKNNQFTIVI